MALFSVCSLLFYYYHTIIIEKEKIARSKRRRCSSRNRVIPTLYENTEETAGGKSMGTALGGDLPRTSCIYTRAIVCLEKSRGRVLCISNVFSSCPLPLPASLFALGRVFPRCPSHVWCIFHGGPFQASFLLLSGRSSFPMFGISFCPPHPRSQPFEWLESLSPPDPIL